METIWYVMGVWTVAGLVLFLGPWTERDDWPYKPMWIQRLIFFAYGPLVWILLAVFVGAVGVYYFAMSRRERKVNTTQPAYRASDEPRDHSRQSAHETTRTPGRL